MARWSVEQVQGHAPDDRSRKAAVGLAKPGPWSDTGSTDSLVWGKCQGSGKKAYQVVCDLDAPAFKCSCPSRKFPCKHGLALLMLWARNDGSVDDVDQVADFAADWASDRAERAATKAEKKTAKAAKPSDPAAAAKRQAERITKMDDGLSEFERWLLDLIRQGLAAARHQPYAFWNDAAARLVDGQLPSLADEVRQTGGRIHSRPDWPDYLLAELGRWYLAIQAWKRRDELPEPLLADLRTVLGWGRQSEEILKGETVSGRWQVLGVVTTENDRVQSQRTWLRNLDGNPDGGDTYLILDFAAAGGVLRTAHLVGSVVEASLAVYPGAAPARAIFADEPRVVGMETSLPDARNVAATMEQIAGEIATNPWRRRHAVTLSSVTTSGFDGDGRLWVTDGGGSGFPIAPTTDVHRLLAVTGGAQTEIFGELSEESIHIASVRTDEGLVAL